MGNDGDLAAALTVWSQPFLVVTELFAFHFIRAASVRLQHAGWFDPTKQGRANAMEREYQAARP